VDGRLLPDPPLWVSHGRGATFTDVDGHRYLDFNVCDMSAILGYAHPRLSQVIGEQAARGVQMFLPAESALAVCEQLRLRFGLPMWQFTLSVSSANAEAIRIARVATGRQGVLLFGGKYHGMLDETLWSDDGAGLVPEELGVGTVAPPDLAVVDFNDIDAADRVLRLGRTAAVLIEGVLTNCGTVLPEAGFLPGLREACTRSGTLLVMDETHTQFDLFGGAVCQPRCVGCHLQLRATPRFLPRSRRRRCLSGDPGRLPQRDVRTLSAGGPDIGRAHDWLSVVPAAGGLS